MGSSRSALDVKIEVCDYCRLIRGIALIAECRISILVGLIIRIELGQHQPLQPEDFIPSYKHIINNRAFTAEGKSAA